MAHKVFVDLDEEITLAVEKVLKADGNQVILVVPESAMLVSSLVSLKLLSRQIYKNNKMIALVTEDKVGQELAGKAGLVAVEKVSDVKGDTWKKALELRENFKKGREKIKRNLVGKREEGEEVEMTEEETNGASEDAGKKGEPVEDYFQGMPEKPRLGGKLVTVGGFPIYAGGDIKDDIDILKGITEKDREARAEDENNREEKMRHDGDIDKGESSEDEPSDDKKKKKGIAVIPPEPERAQAEEIEKITKFSKPAKKTSFVGRDLTSVTGAPLFGRRTVGAAAAGGDIMQRIKDFFSGTDGKKKIYIGLGIGAVLVLFFLGYFILPTITFNITLAEADVPVNEDVHASLTESTTNFEKLTVPARKVEVSKNSSKTATATGKGETGDKAEGIVNFFNKTQQSVTIPAGITLTMTSNSSLKYKTKTQVTIAAAPENGVVPSDDVQIESETFGDKYNTTGTKVFSVAGYNVDDLNAQSFTNIAGGTTEEVTEISQEDFDDLRNELTEELQGIMLGELDALVSDNEVKLEGTQKFSEPKVTAKNKVGDDIDELDMTVEITGTMLVVSENNLTDMANYLVKQKDKLEGDFEIKDISELEVGTATLSGDVASFNLRLQGSIKASIDEQTVKDAVRGKSYLDGVRIIKEMPDVKELTIDYSPEWMPIKRIPSEDEKITVVFK